MFTAEQITAFAEQFTEVPMEEVLAVKQDLQNQMGKMSYNPDLILKLAAIDYVIKSRTDGKN